MAKIFAEEILGRKVFAGAHPKMWEGSDISLQRLHELGVRRIISLEERKSDILGREWLELGEEHTHQTSKEDTSFFIQDFHAPSPDVLDQITQSIIHSNEAVYIHCRGGLGRTGTVLAALLISSQDYEPNKAIKFVRQNYEKYAIETESQERCLYNFKQYLLNGKNEYIKNNCNPF